MESANTHHHHQLQDQQQHLVSNSLGISSNWPPSSTFMNGTGTNGFSSSQYPINQSMLNSSSTTRPPQQNYTPTYTLPTFNWPNQNIFTTNQHMKEQHLSDQYYRRYTDLLSTTETANFQENVVDDDEVQGTKLLLKSFSSGNLINKINNIPSTNNGRFTQIFPTINDDVTPLDMNLEAVDLLASSRFNADFINPSSHSHFRDNSSFSFGFNDHMQHPQIINPFYASNKASAAVSCNAAPVEQQTKRNSNKMDQPKALIQNAPKKSRLEARSSCPPFKVRKEKLGDRIAALQQLVAPFGKTDTASVLMEAIGYIKFLQSQVETLSVPYMKASRNKPNRLMKGGPGENEYEESKRDLKSRGLCLVPLTCLSYITDGGGGAVWAPPQFGGAT